MNPQIELLSTGLNVTDLSAVQRITVNNPTVPAVGLPGLSSANQIDITDNPLLLSVDLSALKTFTGAPFYSLGIARNPLLGTLNLNALVSAIGSVDFDTNVALTNLQLNALVFVSGFFSIAGCSSLVSLSLPALVQQGTVYNFYASNCAVLANLNFPKWMPTNGRQLLFDGCALTQASVDHVLARCIANQGFVSGIVNLSGGTSSAPSATGMADKATLTARGVTVLTN